MNASEAQRRARPGDHVMGWKLEPAQREALLGRFPPRYDKPVADHVTLRARVDKRSALPDETQGEIVGMADDGEGAQAMVVRIAGATDRPGGGTYHITWSLAEGRKAKESNDVIAARGWQALPSPVPVQLQPAFFR
jgi:hypothetical protein